ISKVSLRAFMASKITFVGVGAAGSLGRAARANFTIFSEASTPTTLPFGSIVAISRVIFPLPQPTSRTRSSPRSLVRSKLNTSCAIAACSAESRAYSDRHRGDLAGYFSVAAADVKDALVTSQLGTQ